MNLLLTGSHMKDSAYGMFGRGDTAGRSEFKAELAEMVQHLYNCPCIAMWVIFNEGWGQFDAEKMHDFVRSIDDTRTIDHASGWHDQHIGQVRSDHVYFKKYSFKADKYNRAVLLSELHQEKFQGIRPAVGYPSMPDTGVNFIIDQLLGLKEIGISITENGAMMPHASVTGLMIAHPKARYFSIGKISEEQMADYALRRGLGMEEAKKFLQPLLAQ